MAKEDGVKLRGNASKSGQSSSSDSKAADKNLKKPEVGVSKSKQFYVEPMTTLLLFSTAMLVLPLGTYFMIRHYVVDSTTIGAMGAIVMVQIIVAAYIYKAWHDENKEYEAQTKAKKR